MKQLQKDVKTILTKTAFNIPPHIIGKTLATPRRRLAAISVDLLIASIIPKIDGLPVLFTIAILLMLPTFFKGMRRRTQKKTRIILFILGVSILLAIGGVQIGKNLSNRFIVPMTTGELNSPKDSVKVTELLNSTVADGLDPKEKEELKGAMNELENYNIKLDKWIQINGDQKINTDSFSQNDQTLVKHFYLAFQKKDSTQLEQYWPPMEVLIAGPKIEQLYSKIDTLDQRIDDLKDDLEDKEELLAEPSFSYIFEAIANDIGLSIGWIAVFMILCWWLFDGSSPGKWLFHIKIIRMNGSNLKLWYCFERFSGFAAGVATGMLGFLQIYWDDNRQCIHDKIASTVVINTKPRRKRKRRPPSKTSY